MFFFVKHLLTWMYFRLWLVVVDIFWLVVGGSRYDIHSFPNVLLDIYVFNTPQPKKKTAIYPNGLLQDEQCNETTFNPNANVWDELITRK